jgi:DDE superfamily endonuclease
VNQKQITKLKQEQETLDNAGATRRAFAVLLLVTHGDIELSGYTKDHAKRLKAQYLKYGIDAFRDKRTSQRDRVLTKAERTAVIDTLAAKRPKDVIAGCDDERWSTYWLGEYILGLTGKRYKSKTSHYLLFREAKLTFHLPGKQYEKSDPATKAAWIKATEPLLEQYWRRSDTVILCEDEMILTNATTTQKVWLPQGQYPPVLEINTTRKRQSFYGFLNLKTGVQHTFVTDWQNMYITVEVLTKVRQLYPKQKLVIFWDNAGWHRGSKVMEWIEADGNTETVYFPPYTPDFNPQEHVWKAGRSAVTHNRHITKLAEVAEEFKQYLESQTFCYGLLGFRAG